MIMYNHYMMKHFKAYRISETSEYTLTKNEDGFAIKSTIKNNINITIGKTECVLKYF